MPYNDPKKRRASQRKHYIKNRREILNACRAWQLKNPDTFRYIQHKSRLKIKYDLTPKEYKDMLEEQGGVCANENCKRPPGRTKLCVDEDRQTQPPTVRGLLCLQCNAALGLLREDPSRFAGLIYYLGRHGSKPKPVKAIEDSTPASPQLPLPILQ